jgi:hypothetical protein
MVATTDLTADEAFHLLRETSQRPNVKLRDVAEHVVAERRLPDGRGSGTMNNRHRARPNPTGVDSRPRSVGTPSPYQMTHDQTVAHPTP